MIYFLFSIGLIIWCVLHSALISLSVTNYLKKHLGNLFRFYRLFFNLVSLATLAPVVWYGFKLKSTPFFEWNGYLKIVQLLLLGTGIFLFAAGARHYNGSVFLGIKQIREKTVYDTLSKTNRLDMTGVLGFIRHPWYAGAIALLWAQNLDLSVLLENILFTLYLIIGAFLEEYKLGLKFGDQYQTYQKTVSMFIPYKRFKQKFGR
jgi:protein-S-isoprenylcysteine O-methyltransferase Ste14